MARIGSKLALALVVAIAAAAALADARVPDYHPSTFTVTGKVQCQDCTKNWNAYAYNAKPIPGSFPSPSIFISGRCTSRTYAALTRSQG